MLFALQSLKKNGRKERGGKGEWMHTDAQRDFDA
jgi:hypothetical protein